MTRIIMGIALFFLTLFVVIAWADYSGDKDIKQAIKEGAKVTAFVAVLSILIFITVYLIQSGMKQLGL